MKQEIGTMRILKAHKPLTTPPLLWIQGFFISILLPTRRRFFLALLIVSLGVGFFYFLFFAKFEIIQPHKFGSFEFSLLSFFYFILVR